MIINVKVRNHLNSNTISIDSEATTARQCFETAGVVFAGGSLSINSEIITEGELDETMSQLMDEYEIDANRVVFLSSDNKSQNA